MHKDRVRTAQEALVYLTDCNLATVGDLACRKSPPKSEFKRQVEMAQSGVNWILEMDVKFFGTRIEEVIRLGGNVQTWSEQFKPTCK